MLGYGELFLILLLALILFGGKKLPELAESLGKGFRLFKKALDGEENPPPPSKKDDEEP